MGQGNAIVAKLGLDRSEFSKGLQSAYADAEAKGKQASRKGGAAAAHGEGGGESEGIFRGERRVEHAGVSLVRGLSQAKSGAQAFASVAEGAVHALNIPLGASIALAGIGIAWEQISEAMEKTEKANEDAKAELEKPINVQSIIANPEEAFKGIDDKVKELKESLSFKSYIGDKITGGHGTEESVKLQAELEEKKFAMAEKASEAIKEEGEAEGAAAKKSQAYLQLVKERFATQQKINAIAASDIPQELKTTLKDQAREQLAAKEEAYERGEEADQAEMSHAKELTYIRGHGDDAELKAAEENVRFAKEKQRIAESENELAGRKAAVETAAAEQEQVAVQQRVAASKEEYALREKIANMVAPASVKQRAQLQGEIDALKKEAALNPDKARENAPKIAEGEDRMRGLNKADAARQEAAADELISAGTGAGEGEKLKALQQRLALATAKFSGMLIAQATGTGTDESDELARQAAKINGLKQETQEMLRSRQEALGVSKEDGAIMDLQAKHLDHAAELLKIHLDFAQKIAQAHRDDNTTLEKQLKLNEQKAIKAKNAEFQQQSDDREKLTLGDLAAHGTGKSGAEARRAQALEDKAHREALHGHLDLARQSQAKADKIKNGIAGLKNSEKIMGDAMKGALDACQVLKNIDNNTANPLQIVNE